MYHLSVSFKHLPNLQNLVLKLQYNKLDENEDNMKFLSNGLKNLTNLKYLELYL